MNEHKPIGAVQADLVAAPRREPSPNPFAQSANVTITVPETVEIRLVDASALADYEIWSIFTSIFSSAVVGFVVAYFQATVTAEQHLFLITAILFLIVMTISILMAIAKRRRLTARARKVRFRLGDQVSEDNGI